MNSDLQSIDDYISSFPAGVQTKMQELRSVIQATAPEAREKISYRMPTYHLNGNLVHFAAFKNHIGLYPGPSAVMAFAEQLRTYNTSKGAIRFPLGQPLPLDLVRQIVAFRVQENTAD